MDKKSPCYTCANRNVYDLVTRCFQCNLSGIKCDNKHFQMYRPRNGGVIPELPEEVRNCDS